MNELPGQISRDDDINNQRNILANHRNSFDKGLTKSEAFQYLPIWTASRLEKKASIWNNHTNQVDAGTSSLENKFEPDDSRKTNNSFKKQSLLYNNGVMTKCCNNLSEQNNINKATEVKFNVNTPGEKRYIKKGKGRIMQQWLHIHQDKHLRTTYDIHQVQPCPQGNRSINTDDQDDDDDDNNRLLWEEDIVTDQQEMKEADVDKQSNEELDEERWAERVRKDRKQGANEGTGTRKQYQKGCMSEAASRREMIRLMQKSVLENCFRKSLYTIHEARSDDTMEVSSVESLAWEERPMTPISSDSQEDFKGEEVISKPLPLSQSENPLISTMPVQESNTKFPLPYRFQYFLDVPDHLDMLVPAEQGTTVKCHIIKYTNGMVRNFCPIYYLYVMNENGVGTFLLAARKRFKCMGSSYVICKDSIDLSRGGSSYVAKLKANLVGTEYRLLCKRCNAEKSRRSRKPEPMIKPLNEIAAIIYEYANILGISNPETLTVIIPRLNSCQERMEVIFDDRPDGGLIEKWRQHDLDDIIEMPNKKPCINEETNRYELNFYGRSPEYSYKNFQILCDDSIALQVGQLDKDLFFMDLQYPLCTLQAFAIALSCFDRK